MNKMALIGCSDLANQRKEAGVRRKAEEVNQEVHLHLSLWAEDQQSGRSTLQRNHVRVPFLSDVYKLLPPAGAERYSLGYSAVGFSLGGESRGQCSS